MHSYGSKNKFTKIYKYEKWTTPTIDRTILSFFDKLSPIIYTFHSLYKQKKKILLKKVSANIINFINIKSNFPSSIVLSQTFDGNPPAPSFEFNFPISDCFLSAFSPRKTGPCPRLPAEFVLTVVRTLN